MLPPSGVARYRPMLLEAIGARLSCGSKPLVAEELRYPGDRRQ